MANISGTEQDIDNRKMALQTAISPALRSSLLPSLIVLLLDSLVEEQMAKVLGFYD